RLRRDARSEWGGWGAISGPPTSVGAHLTPEVVDGRLHATLAVRDVQRGQRHLHGAEHTEDHRRVDVAHVGDAERLAGEVADPHAEDHAALVPAVVGERARVA